MGKGRDIDVKQPRSEDTKRNKSGRRDLQRDLLAEKRRKNVNALVMMGMHA